jgi:hypothetical protein
MLPPIAQPSPLVDVGLNYITELGHSLPTDHQLQIREVLIRYLARLISYKDCVTCLGPILGTSQPIDRLEAILCTPQSPLPALPFGVQWTPDSRAKTRPWTAYEDQRLLAAIHRFGFASWQAISQFVGNGRTKAQCSQRWSRGLDPKICKEHWEDEQDDKLVELVARYGEKSWTRIASELGNRCDVQCRYRYKQLEKAPGFAEKFAAALETAKQTGVCPKEKRSSGLRHKYGKGQCVAFQPPFQFFPQPFMPGMVAVPPPPPAVQVAMQTGPVVPPGSFEPPKIEVPSTLPPIDPAQISTHGSAFDWTRSCGLSASGSVFGISPMNSFKFDS